MLSGAPPNQTTGGAMTVVTQQDMEHDGYQFIRQDHAVTVFSPSGHDLGKFDVKGGGILEKLYGLREYISEVPIRSPIGCLRIEVTLTATAP